MAELEERLERAFTNYDIAIKDRVSIMRFLDLIKLKDEETYKHSIRCGIMASLIGEFMHLDPKALFFTGALHDVGKALIPPKILKKRAGFDEKDYEVMKQHPQFTYDLLSGIHDFSANVGVRHHRFQENRYPITLPNPDVGFSDRTLTIIDFYARLIALADFYIALDRDNDKFSSTSEPMNEDKKRRIILERNLDLKYLINSLYNAGIFGEQRREKIIRPINNNEIDDIKEYFMRFRIQK